MWSAHALKHTHTHDIYTAPRAPVRHEQRGSPSKKSPSYIAPSRGPAALHHGGQGYALPTACWTPQQQPPWPCWLPASRARCAWPKFHMSGRNKLGIGQVEGYMCVRLLGACCVRDANVCAHMCVRAIKCASTDAPVFKQPVWHSDRERSR